MVTNYPDRMMLFWMAIFAVSIVAITVMLLS